MTQTEMVAASGLKSGAVSRYCNELHANGKAFIGGWKKPYKLKPLIVWHPGPGEDVPCPFEATTSTERNRRRRAIRRPIKRDPLFAMFFGATA